MTTGLTSRSRPLAPKTWMRSRVELQELKTSQAARQLQTRWQTAVLTAAKRPRLRRVSLLPNATTAAHQAASPDGGSSPLRKRLRQSPDRHQHCEQSETEARAGTRSSATRQTPRVLAKGKEEEEEEEEESGAPTWCGGQALGTRGRQQRPDARAESWHSLRMCAQQSARCSAPP